MKTYYISCLILSIVTTLHSQQAAPQSSVPPLPPGPLLKRAPDYSTWTVTYEGHPTEDKGAVKPSTTGEEKPKGKDAKEAPTMLSSVVKTGSIILEQNVDAAGHRNQIWHVSGMRVVTASPSPVVCPDFASADIFSTNFASSDFAGLYWLSPTTYAGVVKYQGNDCLVFKGSVSPLGEKAQADEQAYITESRSLGLKVPDALRIPAVAYIDLETRLPVYVQFGNEKRIYQYGPAPTQPLTLPPDLAGPVKEYSEKLRRLSAPAARAF